MNENEQNTVDTSMVDTASIEEPKESKVEETQQETKQDSMQETILSIKQGYEEKIAKQKAEADKAIKERDAVIKQLLSGENTAKEPTIIDKINAKRIYKKW